MPVVVVRIVRLGGIVGLAVTDKGARTAMRRCRGPRAREPAVKVAPMHQLVDERREAARCDAPSSISTSYVQSSGSSAGRSTAASKRESSRTSVGEANTDVRAPVRAWRPAAAAARWRHQLQLLVPAGRWRDGRFLALFIAVLDGHSRWRQHQVVRTGRLCERGRRLVLPSPAIARTLGADVRKLLRPRQRVVKEEGLHLRIEVHPALVHLPRERALDAHLPRLAG